MERERKKEESVKEIVDFGLGRKEKKMDEKGDEVCGIREEKVITRLLSFWG